MSIPQRTSNPRKTIIIYEMNFWSFFRGFFEKYRGNEVYYHGMSYLLKTILDYPLMKILLKTELERYIPPKYISEYKGSFFLIDSLTVELTDSFFNDIRIADGKANRIYKNHYSTIRFDTVIKFFIQDRIRNFLRFYYQVRRSGEDVCIVVPEDRLYRYVLEKNPFSDLRPVLVIYSGLRVLSSLRILRHFSGYLLESLLCFFKQKYALRMVTKRSYKVCMRAHFPKNEGLLRNDFLIDVKQIMPGAVLFFIDDIESENGKEKAEYFRTNKYNYTGLNELRIPLKDLPDMLSDYIFLPLKAFILYLWEGQETSFSALLTFSGIALKTRYKALFYNYEFKMLLLFHSAGSEMLILPVLCRKHGSKIAIYNYGTTVSWSKWSPYAFQAADYYFTWGENIISLYSKTCDFGEIVKTGFWGNEEYKKIYSRRVELKEKIIGMNSGRHVVTFYDLPYFYERSTFTAKHLFDFYNAALACSKIDNVTVIIKMKSRYNIGDAEYPSDMNPLFERLWQDIEGKGNIIILDTSEYDPLHIIAISDINVTLELSSPSTIALICGEAGVFYNVVYDYANHSLYPKYFDRLIFDNVDKLINAIKKHLRREIDLRSIADDNDLKGYDEYRDGQGLSRLRHAVLERVN